MGKETSGGLGLLKKARKQGTGPVVNPSGRTEKRKKSGRSKKENKKSGSTSYRYGVTKNWGRKNT